VASKLVGRVVARRDLSEEQIARMFDVFGEHFAGADLAIFRRDLAGKDWVLSLESKDGELQGFSTMALFETTAAGQDVSVVYSGDTIIRPPYWGTPELARLWIRTIFDLSAGMKRPLYWLLISSGYRTYRFLPVFYRDFYPRHDHPSPERAKDLVDDLAARRFGADYDPSTGIVRFGHGATPLRAGIGELTPGRLSDPHVAFFVARNPGHTRGDELVCLTEIGVDNLTAAGWRMAGL
jgi:hypothetical protein